MSLSEISPVNFFKLEFQSDSTSDKVRTLHRIKYIATVIGPEKTRSDLLPILAAIDQTEEDEIFYALAEELNVLLDFVGGPEYFHLLFPMLQSLLTQEETVVRDQAVATLVSLVDKSTPTHETQIVNDNLIPLIEELARGDWFTPKVAACGLISTAYKFALDNNKAELIKIYTALCNDDTPMVRRAATAKLKDVILVCDKSVIEQSLVPLIQSAWIFDTQDAIRMSAMSGCLGIASRITNPEDRLRLTLPMIQTGSIDRSWRVRLRLAKSFDEFVVAYGSTHTSKHLLSCFQNLLKDGEYEVKTASVQTLGRFICRLSPNDIKDFQILETLKYIIEDQVQCVRVAVAEILAKVASAMERSHSHDLLLGLILDLMKDELHEVRLAVICNAGEICESLNVDDMSHALVSTIEGLMGDTQWRVRLEVINQIPRLAKQFGAGAFQSKLEPMFLGALNDHVYAVRECAICNVKNLGETFGADWTASCLLPKLINKFDGQSAAGSPDISSPGSPGGSVIGGSDGRSRGGIVREGGSLSDKTLSKPVAYLTRVTVLHCVPKLVAVLHKDQIEKAVVPLLVKALQDPVPNVRFAAARIILTTLKQSPSNCTALFQQVKPFLVSLLDDPDVDVQYFSHEALAAF